jgi:AbrB family looped-hinge helix DNA binding protein
MELIQVRQKVVLTIPKRIRDKHGLKEGDVLSLVVLEGGSILLSPVLSRVARHGEQVATLMAEAGVSLEEMMEQLDEKRRLYYQRHYEGAGKQRGC